MRWAVHLPTAGGSGLAVLGPGSGVGGFPPVPSKRRGALAPAAKPISGELALSAQPQQLFVEATADLASWIQAKQWGLGRKLVATVNTPLPIGA